MDKKVIDRFLENYDCPTSYNGYEQLVDIVLVGWEYFGRLPQNLKTVYHDVAKAHDTTRLCLERNLNTLIKVWTKRQKFQKLFSVLPTNAELIARIIEQLRKKKQRDEYSVYDILFA
jgi:hypothetical protein